MEHIQKLVGIKVYKYSVEHISRTKYAVSLNQHELVRQLSFRVDRKDSHSNGMVLQLSIRERNGWKKSTGSKGKTQDPRWGSSLADNTFSRCSLKTLRRFLKGPREGESFPETTSFRRLPVTGPGSNDSREDASSRLLNRNHLLAHTDAA